MKPTLSLHHIAIVEELLGPGRRMVIWTAGCPFRCEGCIEEKLQDSSSGKEVEWDAFYEMISPYLSWIDGITFTGGEPLMFPHALYLLSTKIKDKYRLDIMLYTGREKVEFIRDFPEFISLVDLCVSGPFVQETHGNFLWRGSANQELFSPSGKYSSDQLALWMGSRSKGIHLHLDGGQMFTYGIPVPGQLDELESMMKKGKIGITDFNETQ